MDGRGLKEKGVTHYPQQPHGGELVNLVLEGEKLAEAKHRAKSLPMIRVDLEATITLEMIATGVLSPNKGFMAHRYLMLKKEFTSFY